MRLVLLELFLFNSRSDGSEITPPDSAVQGIHINSYGIRCHHKQELFSQLRSKTTILFCLIKQRISCKVRYFRSTEKCICVGNNRSGVLVGTCRRLGKY